MPDKNTKSSNTKKPIDPHYALSENQHYQLGRLHKAVDAIAALTHDGAQDTARDELGCCLTREDLSCLFEMIGDNIKTIRDDTPFLHRSDLN